MVELVMFTDIGIDPGEEYAAIVQGLYSDDLD